MTRPLAVPWKTCLSYAVGEPGCDVGVPCEEETVAHILHEARIAMQAKTQAELAAVAKQRFVHGRVA